ncbi:MAG: hypothetical protein IT480_12885 [Gammaproteobacteria bacterium]|nr:hypothetical protein [Gammaproteobacteria bacterium]
MLIDTTALIDEAIERLETLREVFIDDYAVCRRAGFGPDARTCGEALEAIAVLLPRLADARAVQEATHVRVPGACVHCD